MTDADYAADREFGEKFMPQVKMCLGYYLLTGQYEEEDTERNTDLIVLTMECKRIGVRIRRYKYYLDYPNDFTIRYTKDSGFKTEFDKIVYDEMGDYFFYGFADESETKLIKWTIGDLNALRKYVHGKDETFLARHQHYNSKNKDTFLAFKLAEVPNYVLAFKNNGKRSNPNKFGQLRSIGLAYTQSKNRRYHDAESQSGS